MGGVTSRRSARVIVIAVVVFVAVVAGLGGWWAITEYQATHGPECTVPRPPADQALGIAGEKNPAPLGLDAVQLQHASTINAVGLSRGEPERARVIAVATAWQESSLRNIDSGDRDSLGLFQQRPSQGWGKPAQLMDPVYAANQFYDHLVKVVNWQDMSLAQAAQKVQRSGFPDAYAKWEWDAATLVVGLSGTGPVTLSCRRGAIGSTAAAPERPPVAAAAHADPRLAELLAAANAEFGSVDVAPVPAGAESATVSMTPPSADTNTDARALAAWFVARSASFGVDMVALADRQWSGHSWGAASESVPAGSVYVTVTAQSGG